MATAATAWARLGVLGVGLEVGVVEGGRRERSLESRGLVAHVRSPIQKQTSISTPDAEEEADEALAHRPDAAEPDPAGVGRVLDDAVSRRR